MRVAIVEDKWDWQEVIKNAFKKESHEIVGVFSDTSQITYQTILKTKIDILMMDIELEELTSGIQLVDKLNKEPSFQQTSVVFLTSLEDNRFLNEAYNTKASIAHYIDKTNFLNRSTRTVKEIIQQVENQKPAFIVVHGTKIFIRDIFWVTIDRDYEEETKQKRLAIVLKDTSVVFANSADLKDFIDHTRESPLYAKAKLEYISKDTLVNVHNAHHLSKEGTRDYFIDFSLDQKDPTLRLKMSQQRGAEIYNKYAR